MSTFRIEKTRNYTIMSNHHLQNRKLSLKAKGLMSLLLSLPDDWVHTLSGLAQISTEGVDAIRMAIRELEQEGYIDRKRIRNANGQLGRMEYVVYEYPQTATVSGEPDTDSPALEEPMLENPIQVYSAQDIPTLETPVLESTTLLNTNRLNKNKEKKNELNTYPANPYQSIPNQSICGHEQPGMVAQYKELVQNHIEYEIMCQQYDWERLDEIVYLIVEVLCSKAQYITISGEELPADLVRERLLKFRSSHLQYVFECLNKTTSRVHRLYEPGNWRCRGYHVPV